MCRRPPHNSCAHASCYYLSWNQVTAVVAREAAAGLVAVVVEIATGGNPLTHGRRVEEDGLVLKPILRRCDFLNLST